MQIKQFIREEGPSSHQAKAGTPTMGGILIVAATLIPTLFWADLADPYVLLAIFAMLASARSVLPTITAKSCAGTIAA